MNLKSAEIDDMDLLLSNDSHINRDELENLIRLNRVFLIEYEGTFAGWFRYNLFWDAIPFLNLLYIFKEFRGSGLGRQAVTFWEQDMKRAGYSLVMTSTVSGEFAQHFYYKLGYQAVGGFMLANEPYEIILQKCL
ncbi:MAG TPA: GNAT family N-acetyltransferase [Candidatus Hungatella pullicola]|nr:GNAT family N-acetyltransferase [Candidatus Hungatella pullicola]